MNGEVRMNEVRRMNMYYQEALVLLVLQQLCE